MFFSKMYELTKRCLESLQFFSKFSMSKIHQEEFEKKNRKHRKQSKKIIIFDIVEKKIKKCILTME